MRSTMTLYRAGSPIRVPPSFTNSAVTPSLAPSVLTRAINAGGKLYSLPQRRPTFFMFVLLGGARLSDASACFGNKVPDHRLQVTRLLVHAQLPVRAGAFVHDRVDIFDRAAAAQVVDDVVHQFQQFGNQLVHGHFGFLAEVDQFSIDAVSRRAPLIFFDQCAPVQPPAQIALVEAVQLHNDRLCERGDGHGLFDPRRDIKHAEFQCAEHRVRAHVPPNLFSVVDAIQLHEKIHEIFVRTPRFELLRHTGPREPAKHRRAEGLQSGISAHPEGRTGRKRQEVRQEIAHAVHHVDGRLFVRHGHVNVHAEDEQRPRQLTHLFDDVLIALAGRDDLVDPARKWVCTRRGHLKSGAFGGGDELAARAVHFDAQLAYVFADARAGFDDGLVQLVLHLLRDVRGSRGDELADVRTQFARRGINNLELFFDSDGKTVSHGVALRVSWSCWGLRASYHTPGRLKNVPLRLVAGLSSI